MTEDHSGDELVRAFTRWVARERAGAAAEERARRRWLGEQAAAGATLVGILVDLAEQASDVTLSVGDRNYAGQLVGVGRDFCVLSQNSGRPAVVALEHISVVAPGQGVKLAAGDRAPALDLTLAGALAAMAEERLPVAVRIGTRVVEGELHSVGETVVTIRGAPPGGRMAYLPLRAVEVCELR